MDSNKPLTINTDIGSSPSVKTPSLAARLSNVVRRVSVSAPASPAIAHSPAPSMGDCLEQLSSMHTVYPLDPDAYQVEQVIGYGSSATVYLARCKPLNTQVALKMIDLDSFERDQIDELRRELQIMILSKHPNLLPVYGSFVDGAKLILVMPFMAAGSCLDIMRLAHQKGMEEACIATILKRALQGLEYLHKNGHIHRDVKAGNLLMDTDGSVLLADFGVSSSLQDYGDRKVRRKTFVGTPCWMAPEVLSPDERGYDFKADIWSFGITALELANGHAPYAKYPPLKVLMLTMSRPPPTLNRDKTFHKYSRTFRDMIESCLQKDPTKRPTAEKLLQHSFFKQAKKKDFLVKALLEDLPPMTARPAPKPIQKTVTKVDSVQWNFEPDEVEDVAEVTELFHVSDAYRKTFATASETDSLFERERSTSNDTESVSQGRDRSATLDATPTDDDKRLSVPGSRRRFTTSSSSLSMTPEEEFLFSPRMRRDTVESTVSSSSDAPPSIRRGRFSIQQADRMDSRSRTPSTCSSPVQEGFRKGRFEMLPLSGESTPPRRIGHVRFASVASDISRISQSDKALQDQVYALIRQTESNRQSLETVLSILDPDSGIGSAPYSENHESDPLSLVKNLEAKIRTLVDENTDLQRQVAELRQENNNLRGNI